MIPASSVSHSADRPEALAVCESRLDLRPKRPDLAGLGIRLFRAPLREAVSSFRNPVVGQQRPSYTKGMGKRFRDAGRAENFR